MVARADGGRVPSRWASYRSDTGLRAFAVHLRPVLVAPEKSAITDH